MKGFFASFLNIPLAFLWSTRQIVSSSKLLRLCLAPFGVGFVLFVLFTIALFLSKSFIMSLLLGNFDEGSVLFLFISGFFSIAIVLFAVILAFFSVIILNEWLCDSLIRQAAAYTAVTIKPERPFLFQVYDSIVRLVILLPFTVVAFIFSFIPLLHFVGIGLASLTIGYSVFDCVLAALGNDFKQRISTIFNNFAVVFITGLLYFPTFFVPFLSLFLLPVAYIAAVKLVSDFSRNS